MIAPNWTVRAVPIFAGQHNTHIDTGEDYGTCTLADIFAMEPGCQPKSKGLAFLPSTWNGHDARCHAVQREHGVFVSLTGDIDKGDHPFPVIERLVRQFVGNAAWLIYSSPHARHRDRRWRAIVPLDVPARFALWHDPQMAFFDFMEAHGVTMDRALCRAGQPVYLPNVPRAHQGSGEPLRDRQGAPLHYQHATTGIAAAGLRMDVGPVSAALAGLWAQREADDGERQYLRAAGERRRASRSADDGESPIDHFNRTNGLAELLTGTPRYRDRAE